MEHRSAAEALDGVRAGPMLVIAGGGDNYMGAGRRPTKFSTTNEGLYYERRSLLRASKMWQKVYPFSLNRLMRLDQPGSRAGLLCWFGCRLSQARVHYQSRHVAPLSNHLRLNAAERPWG